MSNETDKPAPLESSKADHVPVPSVKICDGFECFADEFCSNSENRCRSCELFKTFCNDSDLIHQKAPACETYCQKILVEELEKECSADLNSTFTELQERIGAKETEWRVLTNQSKESLTKCSRAQYQLTSRLEERGRFCGSPHMRSSYVPSIKDIRNPESVPNSMTIKWNIKSCL
ncbi:hypothetical protein V1264_012990 [Littorina saxatilis]|uniref:Uncharacterized protein n=1 Tax=Littorina saxatilis TaxID=31220 RepID=A0AAN9BYQ5_9CAEN